MKYDIDIDRGLAALFFVSLCWFGAGYFLGESGWMLVAALVVSIALVVAGFVTRGYGRQPIEPADADRSEFQFSLDDIGKNKND